MTPRAPRRDALRLVATCSPGLETILAAELAALGADGVEATRSAVRFVGGWPLVWRANYWLRTANRVLIELASFAAATSEDLYRGASAVLGRVDHLLATGAHDVLVLDSTPERLIPFIVDAVVKDVDVEGGCIVVDWSPSY